MNNQIIEAKTAFATFNLRYQLDTIVYNMIRNQFILGEALDKPSTAPYEDLLIKSETTIISGSSVIWYAWKNNIPMKIILTHNKQNNDTVRIEPLKPFKTKHVFESKQESTDIGFYIQCCIEILEHFVIFEIKTTDVLEQNIG